MIRLIISALSPFALSMALPSSTIAQPVVRSHRATGQFDVLIADARETMLADPKVAITKARVAERFAEDQQASPKRAVMIATARWMHGEALLRLNDLNSAEPLIRSALATAKQFAPNGQLNGDALLSVAWIDTVHTKVASALASYQQAYAIFQKVGDLRSQSKALQSIGSLYAGANDYPNALRYYDQAIGLYKADPKLALALYNNRGNALKELGRYDEADRQLRDALVAGRQMGSPLLVALVYANLAEAELAANKVQLADQSIAAALRLTTHGEAAGFHKQLYALAARAAYQHHDLPKAAKLLDERFARVDLGQTTIIDREAHRTAYEVYKALGRNDLALRHLAALKRLDDEATNLARSTNAALMGARFDFANQELKIAKLRQDELARNVADERARARTQRLAFLGTAGGTAIIIAMLLFALRTSRRARERVQVANDDLAVTNDALGKALAAKTEFLATTSHEIRTPLNGILGMTQVMLVDDTLGIATRDRLKVVHEAGVTMRALVDDILDVAKMETGNLTIEEAPFDLAAMMVDATRLWTVQAEAKGLGFERVLDDCPAMICGDAARVRQILFNLLSNALKFTASGTVSLRVARAKGGDRYRIVVRDSGIGIPEDKRETIFESFRQADTSTTRQFGGTGLGLSICRNLARAMGGDVTVESVAGEGSTFTVDLPLAVVDAVATDPCASHDGVDLLIVDRNPITRNMLKALFAPHMATIEFAGSLSDAVDRVAAGGIAQVLVDDATARLGDARTDLAALAASGEALVTLLWPVSAASEEAELLATGIARVVAKPVTGAVLVERLVASFPDRNEQALVSQAA